MLDHLPEQVVMEILKRLPVKCLMQYRSVCKTWNSLITNPFFISTHLQTSLSNPNPQFMLLRLSKNDKENLFLHSDNDVFDEFKQLDFPIIDSLRHYDVVGCCNGLICLRFRMNYMLHFVVWNPSLQKFIIIPQPIINCHRNDIYLVFGFGYDWRIDDYKVFVASGQVGEAFREVCLFSVNENSWKMVTAICPKYAINFAYESIFVDGVLHWLGYQVRNDDGVNNAVVGFDLNTEQFLVIKLPDNLVGVYPIDLSIMKYQESSFAVLKRYSSGGDQLEMIWVMKKYGAIESWTKVLHLTDQRGSVPRDRVWKFRQNGKVLLEVDHGEMASLDLNCQKMEYLGINSNGAYPPFACSFVGSLVLLD